MCWVESNEETIKEKEVTKVYKKNKDVLNEWKSKGIEKIVGNGIMKK